MTDYKEYFAVRDRNFKRMLRDDATYKTEKEWEEHSTKVLVFVPN